MEKYSASCADDAGPQIVVDNENYIVQAICTPKLFVPLRRACGYAAVVAPRSCIVTPARALGYGLRLEAASKARKPVKALQHSGNSEAACWRFAIALPLAHGDPVFANCALYDNGADEQAGSGRGMRQSGHENSGSRH